MILIIILNPNQDSVSKIKLNIYKKPILSKKKKEINKYINIIMINKRIKTKI